MDFVLPPEIEEVRRRIRRFVDERLIPLESDRANYDEHDNIAPHVLVEMRKAAKAEGLWALQMPRRLGGMELPRIVGRDRDLTRLLHDNDGRHAASRRRPATATSPSSTAIRRTRASTPPPPASRRPLSPRSPPSR